MGILIARPENKEKTDALKAFMKALKINFEEDKITYHPDFEKKIERSEQDFNEGRFKAINTNDLWK